jgi:hypothetical protein
VPRLAIVISAVGSIESLEGTLVSVLENRPADCEIAVVLNGPYADPYDLKDEVRFVPSQRSTSISLAISRALAATRAPFVHLLASGCQVSEGWADAALARFGDRQVGSVAPLVWDAERRGRIFAAGVGYRARGRRYLVGQGLETLDEETQLTVVGPCLFAGFYRKGALDFVGGLSTRLGPRQADADLALMLRHAGFATAIEPRSSVRATRDADAAEGALAGAIGEERLFWRNLSASGRGAALVAHAGMVAAELAGSFPKPRMLARLAGRLWACGGFVGNARHRRALSQLDARAVGAAVAGEHTRIDRSHDAPARSEIQRTRVNAR